ncbi:MAG TPA: biotin/lipoyl-containing protein, partial [Caulobacteraceae bacterium]|nr:biotin/lipoyl-containing protein [Caulobacteraceae bacterium]
WPVKTNAGFLDRLLDDPDVQRGAVNTELISDAGAALTTRPDPSRVLLITTAWALLDEATPPGAAEPWAQLQGFRLNAPARRVVRLQCDGADYEIDADEDADGPWNEVAAVRAEPGGPLVCFRGGEAYEFTGAGAGSTHEGVEGDGAILAPMPGRIVAVAAKAGDAVARGAQLVTLEAMKMEHVLTAPFDGTVTELAAAVGQQVSEGALLARVEASQ